MLMQLTIRFQVELSRRIGLNKPRPVPARSDPSHAHLQCSLSTIELPVYMSLAGQP